MSSKSAENSTRHVMKMAVGKPFGIFLGAASLLLPAPSLYAEEQLELSPLDVKSQTQEKLTVSTVKIELPTVTDSAELLKTLPGANVNQNGPLTGIAQYRGYFGSRVNVTVDNMNIKPAGPNSMDPPLSHVPAALIESITLIRGIAPVSTGLETIGGTIIATPLSSRFGSDGQMLQSGNLSLGYNTVSDGAMGSVFASMANSSHRLHASGSIEQGDDYAYPDGDITPSEYERKTYGLGYGFQSSGGQTIGLDYQYSDTGLTGTPALPMDIISASGGVFKLDSTADFNDFGHLDVQLNYQDLEHVMDNVTLRTPPNMFMSGMPMHRIATTDVDGIGFRAVLTTTLLDSEAKFGLDGDTANHNALITDPTNPMFLVDNFNDAERNRLGVFAEWQEKPSDGWSMGAGARVTRIEMDAGTVRHSGAMMNLNIMTLMSNFNNADRSQSDTNFDLTFSARYPLTKELELDLGVARKNRSPSYQERYLWVPLQSTGGLADGNNYTGDINLKPETSNQLELGLNWNTGGAYLNPRAFYHRIDNYIQGIPSTDPAAIAVSMMMSGTAPLKFANVDATMYGLDADWGVRLSSDWSLDGIVSYTRGTRDDISDNLYRIAPLNGLIAVTRSTKSWSTSLETEVYASQDKVSETNKETASSGYGIVNLRASYSPVPNLSLGASIENLLDKSYQQHLGGVNRASNNSIPVGTRLYGPGTNFAFNANFIW
ncbi:MAG: TonB-dependent receptor [Pseudomonadales bacterium]|nr:TonB-dependent receptor [Pseudomonadales bacterium]